MASTVRNLSVEWQLPRVLTAPAIENWLANLPPRVRKVVVRLGSWRRTGPFADARLQGALCLLHREGVETSAVVPPITFAGERGEAAFSEPDPLQPASPLTPTESSLATSVAGLTIGQLCNFDEEHDHIPELQRQALVSRRYLFGRGDEVALVAPTEVKATGFPRRRVSQREAAFNNRLVDLLAPLGVSTRGSPLDSSYWFDELKTFAFEATENTWDHGRLDFNTRPIRSLRFVRLRRIDIGAKGFNIEDVAPGFEEAFEQYLASLTAARDLPYSWSREGGRMVEVTVADGGVGIAARMAGSFEVFDGPLENEAHYLLAALLPGGTTKAAREPGRGQGFRKMLRACANLSGLTIVRTGRLKVSRTYRQLDGTSEKVDFDEASSKAYTPNVAPGALPLLAGTSISLIFPIGRPAGSPRLDQL